MKSGITEAKTIHKKTRIPFSTIYDNKNRIKSGEGIERKPGSGAREKLSTTVKKRISNLANSNSKYSCARIGNEAFQRGSPNVHLTKIWRHLSKSGYLKLVPKKVPMITERHLKTRVEWCKKTSKLIGQKW
jgi:hypothetical protein